MGLTSSQDAVPLENYHKIYEVVFVDPSGLLNLAAAMSATDFLRVSLNSFSTFSNKEMIIFQLCPVLCS